MIDRIGVIVPTYERPNYAARQMDWLHSIGLTNVLVADGSSRPMAVPDAHTLPPPARDASSSPAPCLRP